MKALFLSIVDRVLDSHPRVSDPEGRQRARLLSAITIVLTVLWITSLILAIFADPDDAHPALEFTIGLVIVWGVMFALNKAGKTDIAALGVILSITAVILFAAFHLNGPPVLLAFLLIPILFSAMFFSFQQVFIGSTILLSLVYMLIARQDRLFEESPYWALRVQWFILLIVTGLTLTFRQHNRNLENIRRKKLEALNDTLQASEARIRALVEHSPDIILEINRDGKIIFISRFSERYLGKNVREVLPDNQVDFALEAIEKSFVSGEPQEIELKTLIRKGRPVWSSIRAGPVKQGNEITSLTITLTEITAQKEARVAIQKSTARLELLYDINRALLAAQSSEQIASEVLARIHPLIPSKFSSIILFDFGQNDAKVLAARFQEIYGYENSAVTKLQDYGLHVIGKLLQDKIIRVDDVLTDTQIDGMEKALAKKGLRSWLHLPLWSQGQLIGALNFARKAENSFTIDEETIGREVANQLAIGIQQNRLLEALQMELTERQRAETQVRKLNAELEKRVLERTAKLEETNKELETFSYSVSHDLRAPLRAIIGFTRILEADYSGDFNSTARKYLRKIIDAGSKMGVMIDELLNFSRLGRKPLNLQTTDINPIIHAIIETYALETVPRTIEWTLPLLPSATADPVAIQQVFTNLIDNALKYSKNREVAHIEIGSLNEDGQIVYFVRDNGVGFNMDYANKLFGVFQRLHAENEFEGTGIGLATVQHIIHRHGGHIWAEAEVDKGATFYFSLNSAD